MLPFFFQTNATSKLCSSINTGINVDIRQLCGQQVDEFGQPCCLLTFKDSTTSPGQPECHYGSGQSNNCKQGQANNGIISWDGTDDYAATTIAQTKHQLCFSVHDSLDLGAAGSEVLFNSALVCLLLNGWPVNPRTAPLEQTVPISTTLTTSTAITNVNIREPGIPAKCSTGVKETSCPMVSAQDENAQLGQRVISELPNINWDSTNKLTATGQKRKISNPASTDQFAGADGPYACSSLEGTAGDKTCVYRAKQIVEGRNPLCEQYNAEQYTGTNQCQHQLDGRSQFSTCCEITFDPTEGCHYHNETTSEKCSKTKSSKFCYGKGTLAELHTETGTVDAKIVAGDALCALEGQSFDSMPILDDLTWNNGFVESTKIISETVAQNQIYFFKGKVLECSCSPEATISSIATSSVLFAIDAIVLLFVAPFIN